ncbi:hypothetical protein [Candidatus Clostridium radicumherbarum]|uniref:Uncharacterized protein n=1 Tax=Candidatus Clostridium radicumherbarum TaxID=3381662 RepID=A0ABW8TND0_9CLOT
MRKLWLFPGGKVASLVELVVIHKFRIGLLHPTQWGMIELIRKDAYGNRNRYALYTEEGEFVFPIKTS